MLKNILTSLTLTRAPLPRLLIHRILELYEVTNIPNTLQPINVYYSRFSVVQQETPDHWRINYEFDGYRMRGDVRKNLNHNLYLLGFMCTEVTNTYAHYQRQHDPLITLDQFIDFHLNNPW